MKAAMKQKVQKLATGMKTIVNILLKKHLRDKVILALSAQWYPNQKSPAKKMF